MIEREALRRHARAAAALTLFGCNLGVFKTIDGSDASAEGEIRDAAPTLEDAEASTASIDSGPPNSNARDANATIDASVTTPDAGPPPECNLNAPFGAPVALGSINTGANDQSFRLSPDGLIGYFTRHSVTAPSAEIVQVKRTSQALPFGSPSVVGVPTEWNPQTPNENYLFSMTGNGLEIYFSRADQSGHRSIFVSTRATTAATFGTGSVVTELAIPGHQVDSPFVREDGEVIYFTTDARVQRAWFDSSGLHTESVPELAPTDDFISQTSPVVTPDDLTIYFGAVSYRGGLPLSRIEVASRTSVSQPFGGRRVVSELDPSVSGFVTYASANGCSVYLTGVYTGGPDVYVASRPPL